MRFAWAQFLFCEIETSSCRPARISRARDPDTSRQGATSGTSETRGRFDAFNKQRRRLYNFSMLPARYLTRFHAPRDAIANHFDVSANIAGVTHGNSMGSNVCSHLISRLSRRNVGAPATATNISSWNINLTVNSSELRAFGQNSLFKICPITIVEFRGSDGLLTIERIIYLFRLFSESVLQYK